MAAPIEGRNVYVACLDVLGFTHHLEAHPGRLVRAYRHLVKSSRVAGGLRFDVQLGGQGPGETLRAMTLGYRKLRGPIVFSDSIFLLTEDDSRESLDELCLYANVIFRQAFSGNILIRGALAVGPTWHYPDERVTTGPGFVKAHLLEQSLDAIGIVLHPDLPDTPAAGPAVEVPTKAGPRLLRPVLGAMADPPSHLPQAPRQEGWRTRLAALKNVAPPAAQPKFDPSHPLLDAMFGGGAP